MAQNPNTVTTRAMTINVVESDHMTDTMGLKCHTGRDVVIPFEMYESGKLNEVGRLLIEKHEQNEKKTELTHDIDGLYWDGAHALYQGLQEMFGTVVGRDIHTMFGTQLPEIRNIEVGYKKTVAIPMGRFAIPGLDNGVITTGSTKKNGRIIFQFTATVKGRHKKKIEELAKVARKIAEERSIYRGQAFKLDFTDDDGNQIAFPEPEFMNLSAGTPFVTFNSKTELLIQSNVWTPITDTARCRKDQVPLKRGVLLAGPYGTGKTLVANKTAYLAHQNGWTFMYCKAAELPHAIKFAQLYMPCVIFAEDIDRVVAGQERTLAIDNVLNALDGVDTKNTEIITVMTTNHLDQINAAMVRPGRIDTVAVTEYPDAETVAKLIHHYGVGRIDPEMNLISVGEILKGLSPANIREVVERAKLYQINLGTPHGELLALTSLEAAAHEIKVQVELINQSPEDVDADLKPLKVLGQAIGNEIGTAVKKSVKSVVASLQ